MIQSISSRIVYEMYECIDLLISLLDALLYVIANTTERNLTSDTSVKMQLLLYYYITCT